MFPKTVGIWIIVLALLAVQLSNLNSKVKQNTGLNKIIKKCVNDMDCSNSQYLCIAQECEHKSFLAKFGILDALGIIIVCLLSVGACMAGIGGGVFNVPIGLLLFQMDAHDAVPFSIAVVTGVMLYRVITQVMKKQMHPFKNQSIINYDIACLFSPSICLGTQIGVLINRVLPSWLILLCFVVLMSYNFYSTKQKYYKQVLKEQNALASKLISKEVKQTEMSQLNQDTNNAAPLTSQQIEIDQRIEEIKKNDCRVIKWDRVQYIALSIATLFAIDLLKGSPSIPSILSIKACSWQWWFMSVAFIPFGLYYVYLIQRHYLKETEEKIKLKIKINENDFKWDKEMIIRVNILGVLVGIVSAMLGIGGGVIVAPVFLQLGLEPSESSATTSFVTLFTSFTNLIKYMLIGSIIWDYSIFSCIAGIGGFYIGLKCLAWTTRNNKQSLIILSLLIIIVLASAMVMFTGVKRTWQSYENGENILKFRSVCS